MQYCTVVPPAWSYSPLVQSVASSPFTTVLAATAVRDYEYPRTRTRSCTVTYSRFDSKKIIRVFRIVSVLFLTYSAVSYSRLWSEDTEVISG